MGVTLGKVFKFGCVGCLGILAIMLLIGVVITGVAKNRAESEELQTSVLTRDLPAVTWTPLADPPNTLDASVEGRVIINLSRGEFEIIPGPSGQPIRVEATYDENSCDLWEGYAEQDSPGWTYKIDFHCSATPLVDFLKIVFFDGIQPKIKVTIPVDTPLALELVLSQGGGMAELGGLWLTSADIEFSQGGFELDVGEPLHSPLERLSITGSMGGFDAQSIGNASPRVLEIDHKMGGLMLDLRGAWSQSADIDIRSSMGGGLVMLPRGVNLVGVPGGSFGTSSTPEIERPTLSFTVRSEMGDIEFTR